MNSTEHTEQSDLVSIIVPTRNSEATLERCLLSLRHQSYTRTETIVIDNLSEDRTEEIARRLGNKLAKGGPERSAQRNLGADLATGDFLLFIDADMELTPRVIEDCVSRIRSFDALIVPEISMGTNWLARIRAVERAEYLRSFIFEAARFFRSETFRSLGGYDISLTGLEDYDIQARLEEHGHSVGYATQAILHHERDLNLGQYLRKKAYYAQSLARHRQLHPERAERQFGIRRAMFYLLRFRTSPRALIAVLSLKFLEFSVFRISSATSRVKTPRTPY